MHSLSELKEIFINKGITIKESMGWYFKVDQDTFTMLDDEVYINLVKIGRKEILDYAKTKPKIETKIISRPKPKIRPKSTK
jgi:hypothetical protein